MPIEISEEQRKAIDAVLELTNEQRQQAAHDQHNKNLMIESQLREKSNNQNTENSAARQQQQQQLQQGPAAENLFMKQIVARRAAALSSHVRA